ncbi:hypothetical protein [Kitasatospora sp. NPDC056531]|uniref:hypothetical protein n=1 Tax=Kitasatospora sp. NPDC056531 TaxID=3345856 RepID=UPI003695BAD5
MRRTTLTLLTTGLLAATAACSSSTTDRPAAPTPTLTAAASAAGTAAATGSPKAAPPAAGQDAAAIAAKIKKVVHTAATTTNITAADDPNKLLGRPHQYTSATVITDSRIEDANAKGADRGATVEVFATAEDAKARAAYIEAIGKAQPIFAEYDFLHGTVLVRVAKALTPDQAAEYDKAAG